MWYVPSLTNVLSDHLGWHRARLKLMARFTASALKRRTADLWQIAVSLKAGVEHESNYRRIQRFLSGYEVNFQMLGGLLMRLIPETPPYEVVVDRTEWEVGSASVNVLVVGIAHEQMAFPITWTPLSKGGGSSSEDQIEVLERFLQVVDPEAIRVLTADREFISTRWLKRLQEEEIPFSIRIRIDRTLGDAPDGPALTARMYARTVSQEEERQEKERVLENKRYLCGTEEDISIPVRVVLRKIGSKDAEDPFLILATWDVDPSEASRLYRRRWSIETMFAALKSRGFDLEETQVTEPDRIQNLIGLLALTFTWARLIGKLRIRREGPPPRKSNGHRQWSVFRYGLDALTSILTTDRSQDRAFFRCLTALRSPTATVGRL